MMWAVMGIGMLIQTIQGANQVNQQRQALEKWKRLAAATDSSDYDAEVLRLGVMLLDTPAVAASVERMSRRRRLEPDEMRLFLNLDVGHS